ncbi:TetR/AcrR family transcriptional regulator [Actinoplanes sp. NPDC026619]|uniref:TetR/AcrR family transcriptional regulator n=1 Tax=Actinoplanes sp. NPDC026619 TaxID=3155798 RepID=UPI0033DE1797
MRQGAGTRPRGAGRAQLHDTALRLFARDGVEGTSLQTIADEMGVTKAAVYYHYRSKDDLVLSVLAPMFEELDAVVRKTEAHRSRPARLEEFLTGMVTLIVDNHSRFAMLVRDPYVSRLMESHLDLVAWFHRIVTSVGAGTDLPGRAALLIFLSGMTAPLSDPEMVALEPAEQRELLLDCGRRLLQIRRR